MIEHTKTEVESKYTVENGYEHDAKVYFFKSILQYNIKGQGQGERMFLIIFAFLTLCKILDV